MNRITLKIISVSVSAAMACCFMSGCVFLPDEEDPLAAPSVEEESVSYSTVSAQKRDIINQDINTGTIRSQVTYDLSFNKRSGTIAKIYVHAGDTVKKGDILCELSTEDLDYTASETELRLKMAKLDKQVLRENGASKAEIDRAQVEIDLIQIEMDEINKQLDNSKLYSPIDGTVSSLGSGVSAGNFIDAGNTVVTVIDETQLYMAISPDKDKFKLYTKGTKLSIVIGEESYDAEVFMTPSELTEKKKEEDDVLYDTYDPDSEGEEAPEEMVFDSDHVYLKFSQTPPQNCVGNTAESVFVVEQSLDAVVISSNLVKTIDGKKIVYLYKDGKKAVQEVTIGLSTISLVEIVSGVEEGDLIIVQ